jgi:hypothetical protein
MMGVLWKGALAIGGGRAAVLAIVTRAFNNDHPNYVCLSISGLACTLYIVNFTWQPKLYVHILVIVGRICIT